MLQTRIIPPAQNAHAYPLLIKSLLLSGSRYEKTREIVYRDKLRYSYATFNERVARLANVLGAAGFILNSGVNGAYPSAVLNVIWMGIGLVALWQIARAARIGRSPD